MSDYDRKWIKWLLLGVVIGYMLGKCVYVLLSLVIANTNMYEFANLIPPGLAIVGLLIVLFKYNKEREDQIGK